MKRRNLHNGIMILVALVVIVLATFGFAVTANSQSPSPTVTSMATPMTSPTPSISASQASKMDVVAYLIAAGKFTTLVKAVQAAGLADTLKGQGPFTVFAPTDDAFNKLPAGTVAKLLNDIPTLKNILLYHVVQGKYLSTDILKVTSVNSVESAPLSFGLTVEGAEVIVPDIVVSNGVIHIIDGVLLPPAGTPTMSPGMSPMTTP